MVFCKQKGGRLRGYKKIGQFTKELRKEKGLTQEQLVEILFVSARTVSRWETCANLPDLSILVRMSEFYGVDIKEILDGERRSESMDQEFKETLYKVADYNKKEREKAAAAGNYTFIAAFLVCTVSIDYKRKFIICSWRNSSAAYWRDCIPWDNYLSWSMGE